MPSFMEVRKDIKDLIDQVGGTANILNSHKNTILQFYMNKYNIKEHTDNWYKLATLISNTIDYFTYNKHM